MCDIVPKNPKNKQQQQQKNLNMALIWTLILRFLCVMTCVAKQNSLLPVWMTLASLSMGEIPPLPPSPTPPKRTVPFPIQLLPNMFHASFPNFKMFSFGACSGTFETLAAACIFTSCARIAPIFEVKNEKSVVGQGASHLHLTGALLALWTLAWFSLFWPFRSFTHDSVSLLQDSLNFCVVTLSLSGLLGGMQ